MQVLNTSENAMTHLFATPVALAQPFLCAWPCFVPQPTAPPSWQSPQSVGWFWPFCFWCVFGFQGAMRDLSEKNRPKPQDFSSLPRIYPEKKGGFWDTPAAPAVPLQPIHSNPPGSQTLVHFTENMLSWQTGANQLLPDPSFHGPIYFFLVFSMVFPLRKAHTLKFCSLCSCEISTFLPRVSWFFTLLTLVEGHFHRICLLRLLCLAYLASAATYPWPFMKPVPSCTCLRHLNISNFLPRFKSSQNCVMFLKKNYLLGMNHKPNHMNHFRRSQQETALQPFRSSQRLNDHVGVHAGQGLIRSQVKTQCWNGWDSIFRTWDKVALKSSEKLRIGDDVPKVFKPMFLLFLKIGSSEKSPRQSISNCWGSQTRLSTACTSQTSKKHQEVPPRPDWGFKLPQRHLFVLVDLQRVILRQVLSLDDAGCRWQCFHQILASKKSWKNRKLLTHHYLRHVKTIQEIQNATFLHQNVFLPPIPWKSDHSATREQVDRETAEPATPRFQLSANGRKIMGNMSWNPRNWFQSIKSSWENHGSQISQGHQIALDAIFSAPGSNWFGRKLHASPEK